ncbi:MAG: Stp1/IreP family PP2C-type Ser/Thr phosphatase [bacterium]|nr:Stp1/IreP family PP2C-type Ser/Thr phosphatase [bacterium]
MSLRYALASDVGRVRENNEDYVEAVPEIGLFLVADGMGGHVGGEVASQVAVQATIEAVRSQRTPKRVRDEKRVLTNAILAANLAIVEEAQRQNLHGMGTTLTVLRIRSRSAIIANVGDSRAYALNKSGLRPLTTDQTVVARMVERGELTREQAMTHPDKHILLHSLGTNDSIHPEVVQTVVRSGTRLLLSTDGIHDFVSEREIAKLAAADDLDYAVTSLIERANALGGPDNATALIVQP